MTTGTDPWVMVRVGAWCVAAALAAAPEHATAQEALRSSLASAEAAAARRQSISSSQYNIRLDPVSLGLRGALGVEFTDNVDLAPADERADVILRPQARLALLWPVTERNSLTLSVGIGYDYYVQTETYRRLFIAPGSDVSFDVYVKDFIINLHSRFQLSQDPTYDPTISGRGSLNRFENATGFQVDWDLNKVVLTLNYDHLLYLATDDDFSQVSYHGDVWTLRAGWQAHPAVVTGVEVAGGLTDYIEEFLSDNAHVSAGPFARWQLSPFTSVRASVGYTHYTYSPGSAFGRIPDFGAVYADVTVQNRLRQNITQALSGGRQIAADLRSTPLDLYYVRYQMSLNVVRKLGIGLTLSYENGEEAAGIREHLERYGAGVSLTYPLTRRMVGQLSYQYLQKDSELPARDYKQNRLVLEASYRF